MLPQGKIPTTNVLPHTTHVLATVESVLMEIVTDLELVTPEDYLMLALLVVLAKPEEAAQAEAVLQ